MIRMRDIRDASAASSYYGKSDGGYYLDSSDLRREVGGKAAELLGLSSSPDFDQFKRLLQGLNPHTGDQLTAKLVQGRLAGWDVTASIPKGVTVALERGDSRIHDALWEAGRETMADLERFITTRERKGGAHDNRTTGNMVWYGFEHPETRPAKQDGMPDPDRHIHFVIPNVTWDASEQQWKAIKFRPVMDLRKWFDRRFDMRLASKLTDLGYQVETKYRNGKYYSWDIKGLPASVVTKFSRRAGEVEHLAEQLGVGSAVGKDKLGATSRMHKRKDMTLADYRTYWDKRVTPEEARQVAEVIKATLLGRNPPPVNTADKGAAFAIAHEFERRSVSKLAELEITAMERCMGGALPEQIEPELRKQGVLTKGVEATTRGVLAEEGRIIAFAREGKGACRPMGVVPDIDVGRNLSPDQAAVARHVLTSPDRVILIRGAAGTGKTHAMKSIIGAIDRPVAVLAPSADASRGVLRREGFAAADTVAAFLGDKERQAGVRNGVIWVDEAGLLPIRDMARLTDVAREQNARIVLQGDPKQHRAVPRDGNLFPVLQQFAGLPVAELTDIRRQRGRYREAVAAIEKGDILKGHDILTELGWVTTVPVVAHNRPLVDAWFDGRAAGKEMLVVAPTHKEGEEITETIRVRLKAEGNLGEERVAPRLVALNWSDAQKADRHQYAGEEWVQFFRNSGPYRAGDRLLAEDLDLSKCRPEHFAVFRREEIPLAVGDTIRVTAGVKDVDGKRIDNGTMLTVTGFGDKGRILAQTASGQARVLPPDVAHISHGYVSTSHSSQGKTVDRVLIAMGGESLGAMNAAQFYVSASRARESATVFTDLPPKALREAIQRQDGRKSATELMQPKPRPKRRRLAHLVRRARDIYHRLRERAETAIQRTVEPRREVALGR